MSLTNTQYDEIMREYARRRDNARRTLDEHMRIAYEALPELSLLDEKRSDLMITEAKRRLMGTSSGDEDTAKKLKELSDEGARLLARGGFPGDYLTMTYICPDCQDTGYIQGQKCHCFEELAIKRYYTQPGLFEVLSRHTFENFSLDYYPEEMEILRGDKKQVIYPRRIMEHTVALCRRFTDTFDTHKESLLFSGGVGLGKTFLSHAIAGKLIASSHTVLYTSAADIFRRIGDEYFSRDGLLSDLMDRLGNADLLIIDDLGTEVSSVVTHSSLFQLLNRRIDEGKSTIISTNLDPQALSETYSERSVSRIISSFTLLPFYGDDIRIQKKLTGNQHK